MNSDWLLKRAKGPYVVGDMHACTNHQRFWNPTFRVKYAHVGAEAVLLANRVAMRRRGPLSFYCRHETTCFLPARF